MKAHPIPRKLLLALACAFALAATAQPTWRFYLAFEDGTGARDTIWMVYDTTAHVDASSNPIIDVALGEGQVILDQGAFNVFQLNALQDTTKTRAYPYSAYPIFDGTIIDAINWTPPMTIRWDTSLFHAPYLPYAQGNFGIALMDGIAFSQFSTGLGFGQYNMLTNDSVTIDFLSDFLFSFPVYFGPVDDTGIKGTRMGDGSMLIWPNPATDKIWLRPALGHATDISITDITGRRLFHQSDTPPTDALDISMLPPGRYFIRILTNQNLTHHGTFEKMG